MPLAFLAPASPRTPGTGASSPQKLPVSPAELKARTEHARELGDRLAAEAWASADRLLLCLCLRAWRLQRRVALQSSAQWQTRPTWKPGQFPVGSPPWHTTTQSTPANLPADASWKLSLLPQTPPLPLPSKARPAFDFSLPNFAQSDAGGSYGLATIGGSQDLPEGALLKRSFLSWKDMVASLALLRVKLENVHLKEKLKQQDAKSSASSSPKRGKVSPMSPGGKVSVDLNSPDRLVKFGISSPKVVTPANLPSFVPDVLAASPGTLTPSPVVAHSTGEVPSVAPTLSPSPVVTLSPTPLLQATVGSGSASCLKSSLPPEELREAGVVDRQDEEFPDVVPAKAEAERTRQELRKSQNLSQLELRVQRRLRTEEHILLRLVWQAWEDFDGNGIVRAEARGAQPCGSTRAMKAEVACQVDLDAEQVGYANLDGCGQASRRLLGASWEALSPSLPVAGLGAMKVAPSRASPAPGNACTAGWANERRELQTQIQRLREQLVQQRHNATESITQLRLSLDAVHAEQDAERTKLQTQLSLQRAYLQAEIVCQDKHRDKAERALEALRTRTMDRFNHPRLLRKAFRAWARAYRETAEAARMLTKLPSVSSPRRLRFLIEDAERDSFSVQCGRWLEDDEEEEEDDQDPRSEEERIYDSRMILQDQAKAAVFTMTKAMAEAEDMWTAVCQRMELTRMFTIAKCQASENRWLRFTAFCGWLRQLQDHSTKRFAVRRVSDRARPYDLAEFFYLWQAQMNQTCEMEKVLGRLTRGSLALSTAGFVMGGADVLKLAFRLWRLYTGHTRRTESLAWHFLPTQDARWLFSVFFAWLVYSSAKRLNLHSHSSRSSLTGEVRDSVRDVQTEFQAQTAPQPHPAPERPRLEIQTDSPNLSRQTSANSLKSFNEEARLEQKETRLVTEAVEAARGSRPVSVARLGPSRFQIAGREVAVQIRNDQVLVQQGHVFVPMAKYLSTIGLLGGTANGSVTPRGSGSGGGTPRSSVAPAASEAQSPQGATTPRSSTGSRTMPVPASSPKAATPKATPKSSPPKATPPKAAAPASPKPKSQSLAIPNLKAAPTKAKAASPKSGSPIAKVGAAVPKPGAVPAKPGPATPRSNLTPRPPGPGGPSPKPGNPPAASPRTALAKALAAKAQPKPGGYGLAATR